MPDTTNITNSIFTTGSGTALNNWSAASPYTIHWDTGAGSEVNIKQSKGKLNPKIAFKLIKKKKMTILGQMKYKNRIEKLKKLAEEYQSLGHGALCKKFQSEVQKEVILAEVSGAGVVSCIKKNFLDDLKWKVDGGHISNTKFEEYTKFIPKNILKKKKNIEAMKVFDRFEIYHYWNEKLEEKKEKEHPLSSEEHAALRDPILFGLRDDMPEILFFIDDWDDEYCDLTFDKLVDALIEQDVIKDEEEIEIPKKPSINIKEVE